MSGGERATAPHVLALVGSLREHSYTRLATAHALSGAEAAGATTELLDLREYDLPPLNPDQDEQGDSAAVIERVDNADAVILGSPMYHGSYSGVLKNALDYCGFDEFEGKTVGLLAVSGGSFPVTTLEHLRSVCRALNAWVLPHQAAVPKAHSAFENGAFVDDDMADRVATLGERVVRYADIESDPPTFESNQNEGAGD
ncbi:NADPH-dependent oxidoreductase [Halonotius terrestris]|uniref:NADPH-dependent oxidoreductase n=1 Tax=Halonotius terrestris TaxID=2487750 RepID=A0A8J8PDC3_9EURY|nr:NAD(P)H-dependent oxidoreductase [Halonotius terrestris]TQQ82958.1 NADPH-dependent oxidoreductase [Halonotius terrestris]